MRKKWYVLFIAALAIWACSSDGSSDNPPTDDDMGGGDDMIPVTFDRGAMLTNWADNIIIPSYKAFQSELSELQQAYNTFTADKTEENLTNFRVAWLDAHTAWQWVSMFEIGPAESAGYRLNMNTYPADTDLIDSFLTTGTFDLSLPANRDAKGFGALDYLLNGLDANDTDLLERWTNGTDAANTEDFINAILSDMMSLTDDVVGQWEGSYRNTFVSNDGSSATASVDRFVNDFIFYYEKFLRAGKMGIPLGVFSNSLLPQNLEAFHKGDVSKALFLEGLSAVQDFFNGKHFGSATTGESLASYLDDLNTVKDGEDLTKLINDQINEARDLVGELGTFREEIENNDPPTNMLLAYDQVQAVVPLLKVDMVSTMSISIDFVDADGD
ncbi:imelysin family protein [Flagellimonas flava]|uniref:Predicted lipoprotein n=1 Tax=Flagellimonas flava TaxID=570519 RepID=A0A1M5HP89_9FLAO|nr:imelysin family protein [Allomuricauda flava]SHG17779.1 Predicted lipoprotein [Allomuricauda flava]